MAIEMDLSDVRRACASRSIAHKKMDPDPFLQLRQWLQRAQGIELREAKTMMLPTADAPGKHSAHIVLLGHFQAKGSCRFGAEPHAKPECKAAVALAQPEPPGAHTLRGPSVALKECRTAPSDLSSSVDSLGKTNAAGTRSCCRYQLAGKPIRVSAHRGMRATAQSAPAFNTLILAQAGKIMHVVPP